MSEFTKQGVRNLNNLGKPTNQDLQYRCAHFWTIKEGTSDWENYELVYCIEVCELCGKVR